jgi:hypothetical protein
MGIKFTAACLFAFTHVAMAQGEPPDAITEAVIVRISADGVCYFLNDSAPCEQLVTADDQAIRSHPIRLGEQYYPPESRLL